MAAPRFLVVDDSPTMRRIVINTLKTIGYTDVLEAADGSEAMQHLRTQTVDLVITDWNMPNMTGLELTRAIRQDEQLQHLPILMVTTRSVKDDIVEALQARVSSYIVKPFTPQVLKEKIDQLLKITTS